jgi:hypothetical protein
MNARISVCLKGLKLLNLSVYLGLSHVKQIKANLKLKIILFMMLYFFILTINKVITPYFAIVIQC